MSSMSLVLIESYDIKVQRYGIKINNQDLFNPIDKILCNRGIVHSV